MMMRKMIIVLVALVFACSALFSMTSCAKKQVMTGAPEKKPPVVAPPPADTEAYKRAEAERQARLAALAAAEGLRGQIRAFEAENINFDFDKSELKPEARAILVKKAEWLRSNPEFSVRIEGHCDERGTNEYNLALGERRANAAWKFLNALGISGSRMTTISYGEERPADPRHNETAWAQNRRDEFKLIR
jgi:peptidoglycan-associated lipoprotein